MYEIWIQPVVDLMEQDALTIFAALVLVAAVIAAGNFVGKLIARGI